MSGGAFEYTAAFNKEYSGDYFTGTDYLSANGEHFASKDGKSSEYKTAYSNTTTTGSGELVYTVSKIGDGIKEVYTGEVYTKNEYSSWHRDYAHFVYSDLPFFNRGSDNIWFWRYGSVFFK